MAHPGPGPPVPRTPQQQGLRAGAAGRFRQSLGQGGSLDDPDLGAQALGLLEPDLDLFTVLRELGGPGLHMDRDPWSGSFPGQTEPGLDEAEGARLGSEGHQDGAGRGFHGRSRVDGGAA